MADHRKVHWFTILNVIVGLALVLALPIAISLRGLGFSDQSAWIVAYVAATGIAAVMVYILYRKLGPRQTVYRIRNTICVGCIAIVCTITLSVALFLGLGAAGLPPGVSWPIAVPSALIGTVILIRREYDS